jgi:hypothetical protein
MIWQISRYESSRSPFCDASLNLGATEPCEGVGSAGWRPPFAFLGGEFIAIGPFHRARFFEALEVGENKAFLVAQLHVAGARRLPLAYAHSAGGVP